jgi:hypothetical protein
MSEESLNETETDFEAFWAAYPRHTGRPEALRVFRRMDMQAMLPGDLLDRLERFKIAHDWAHKDPRYIQHASTWLNQQRYNDVLPNCPS